MTEAEIFTVLSKMSGRTIQKVEVDQWVHLTIEGTRYTIYADTIMPFNTAVLRIQANDVPIIPKEVNDQIVILRQLIKEAEQKINIVLFELCNKIGNMDGVIIDVYTHGPKINGKRIGKKIALKTTQGSRGDILSRFNPNLQ